MAKWVEAGLGISAVGAMSYVLIQVVDPEVIGVSQATVYGAVTGFVVIVLIWALTPDNSQDVSGKDL